MTDEANPISSNNSDDQNTPQDVFKSGIIRKSEYFDLFISYKRDHGQDHGQKLAERLYDELIADGFKVWIDKQEMGSPTDFEDRIEEALLLSKKVICVISLAWVESVNCRKELKKAVEFEKRIIPIHYQSFRSALREKLKNGELTEKEWRKVEKPQEVNFSQQTNYASAYQELKLVARLNDEYHLEHTRILSESYYWLKYNKPKSMLLTGEVLNKAKRLAKKSEADSNIPDFNEDQQQFLKDSNEYVENEFGTDERKVYVTATPDNYEFAAELNIELKLNRISTWFDKVGDGKKLDEKDLTDKIIKSQYVLSIVSERSAANKEVELIGGSWGKKDISCHQF